MLKRDDSFPQGGKSLLRKKIVKRGLFFNGIIRKEQCMRKKRKWLFDGGVETYMKFEK